VLKNGLLGQDDIHQVKFAEESRGSLHGLQVQQGS
jgi:hypothetical protein